MALSKKMTLAVIGLLLAAAGSAVAKDRAEFNRELREAMAQAQQTAAISAPPAMNMLRVNPRPINVNASHDDNPGSQRIVPPPPIARPAHMNDAEKQSLGCLIAGTAGLGVAMAADGVNLINVIAGGLVAPANNVVLYTSLIGVVFASFCAVGQALTPAALMFYERYIGPEEDATPREAPPSLRTRHSIYRPSI